ncbi:MAG TPA: HNH endonuclease signature motif containing protein [Longimicrobium sp.]|nr:HNH endonuclease signature motif containing protein [Longimicrobium sp.]
MSLVYLHPRLTWSEDNDWIEVAGVETGVAATRPVYEDFGEAPDDDPARLAQFARKVRRGQAKFRQNLLKLYGGRCAVSGWAPESVLEAAHILLHADSGLNHSENGILLRADLHILFDDGSAEDRAHDAHGGPRSVTRGYAVRGAEWDPVAPPARCESSIPRVPAPALGIARIAAATQGFQCTG